MKANRLQFSDLPKRIVSAVVFCFLAMTALKSGGLICAIFLCGCFFILVLEVFYISSGGKLRLTNLEIVSLILLSLVPILQFYNFHPILFLFVFSGLSILFTSPKFIKLFCILYIGSSIIILQRLLLSNMQPDAINHVIFIILIVVCSDVGGYIFGRSIGGPKVLAVISPSKTWAGSLGGIFLAIISSYILKPMLNYSLHEIIVISTVLAICSQVGDFIESAIKRNFNVKDSGSILPGHGGLFDRLDGLIFVLPVYMLIVTFY